MDRRYILWVEWRGEVAVAPVVDIVGGLPGDGFSRLGLGGFVAEFCGGKAGRVACREFPLRDIRQQGRSYGEPMEVPARQGRLAWGAFAALRGAGARVGATAIQRADDYQRALKYGSKDLITLYVPYWLIMAVVGFMWAVMLVWRIRRKMKAEV